MKITPNNPIISPTFIPLPVIELGVKKKCCKKYKRKGKHCKRCPRKAATNLSTINNMVN